MVYCVFLFLFSSLMYAQESEVIQSSHSNTAYSFVPGHQKVYITGNNPEYPEFSLVSLAPIITKEKKHELIKDSLAPKEVTLNYEEKKVNPLYGSSVEHMTLLDSKPLVVLQNNPTLLYIQSLGKEFSELESSVIHDAEDTQTAGIIKLCSASAYTQTLNHYVFAAVKKHDGYFGQKGSGIAVIKLNVPQEEKKEEQQKKSEEKMDVVEKKPQPFLDILDAKRGISQANCALDLTECADAFSINDGLDCIMPNVIDMHWDYHLSRLYIALHVKTKDTASQDQGAIALAYATLANDKLSVKPIVYHRAISGNRAVIGATGPQEYVSLHKVRTMHTSTYLPYLIVVGGNGKPEETKNTVNALPLLLARNADVLASSKSKTEVQYKGKLATTFDRRTFTTPAEAPDQLPHVEDKAVCVGAGFKLPSDIVDIAVVQDAVYVIVEKSAITGESGIYHSQAIADGFGRIAAWTPWQLVVPSHHSILGMDLNPADGSFMILENEVAAHGPQIMLRKTGWKEYNEKPEPEHQTLDEYINTLFDPKRGGIQGLYDFSPTTPGLQNKVAWFVTTGCNKVLIAETGAYINGIFTRYPQSCFKELSGGDLEKLGLIHAATIAHDSKQAWLFVAGTGGLAVLCHDDGSGWSLHDDLQLGLYDLDGMMFKKIGEYTFIQKLLSLGTNLFVLTNSTLDRIALDDQTMVNQLLKRYTIAKNSTIVPGSSSCFYDAGVSDSCTVLATSKGLFITTKESNCAKATTGDDIRWDRVPLPDADEVARRLFFVTRTGHDHDFAHDGQVYVLTNSLYDKSHVYRYFVSEKSMVPVPDHQKKYKQHDAFCNFGSLKNIFVTDGSVSIHAHNRTTTLKPEVHCLPEGFSTGISIHHNRITRTALAVDDNNYISKIIRNWATGSWMIAGDFGLRITQ